jgi:hypothetical protein
VSFATLWNAVKFISKATLYDFISKTYRGKFVLVHDLKACRRSGCTAPYILNLVALWMVVVNITVRPLASGEITPVGVEQESEWARESV